MTPTARFGYHGIRPLFNGYNQKHSGIFNSPANRSIVQKSTLPIWASDEHGNVADTVTLDDVIQMDSLMEFMKDKNGCRFLQDQYSEDCHVESHQKIFEQLVADRVIFLDQCKHMFGNFFVQRVLECSDAEEQKIIVEYLASDLYTLCLDKSACRVVQLAFEKLEVVLASRLASELRGVDLTHACIDQNGNHVIQQLLKTLPPSSWQFLVEFFSRDTNFVEVCEDKYVCRVIQSTLETLSKREQLVALRRLVGVIIRNCGQLASNEFANYVVRHVIKCDDAEMTIYRDVIIEKCLLQNLLSMSQEKYASHVVEIALCSAPN